MKNELYFSLDIETDGPIPGPHSMLSFGLAAFERETGELADSYTANLRTLVGASMHPDTKKFWDENPKAFQATRENQRGVVEAMSDVVDWIKKLSQHHNSKAVCVAYPATFDFMFFYWYMIRFVGESPFGFQCLDMKSLAMGELGTPFRETAKRNFPKHWFAKNMPHTHHALDDAIEQGLMFINMMRDICPTEKESNVITGAFTPG